MFKKFRNNWKLGAYLIWLISLLFIVELINAIQIKDISMVIRYIITILLLDLLGLFYYRTPGSK